MRIAWLVLILSGVCVAEPEVIRHWEPVGYQGFAESIDALAGPNAIDCGFLNLLDEKLGDAAKEKAYQCVQMALMSKRPFKFGTLRIPTDSYGYEVLARTPQGELWRVTYDRMLTDDESGRQWSEVCKSVSIDRALVVRGRDCVAKPEGRLER
jgi:hypothetical protein